MNACGEHGELWRSQIALPDGTFPKPLDLLRIPLREAKPAPTQPENWTISPEPWTLLGRPVPPTLHCIVHSAIVKGPDLLGNRIDRISEKYFEEHPGAPSLALIAPSMLQWWIGKNVKGKRQLRASFHWHGAPYSLVVTDVEVERRTRDLPDGLHPLSAAGLPAATRLYLLISLGEPLERPTLDLENDQDVHLVECQRFCYKLVAGVIAI